ncbi:MAG: endolytic transglycosylase MltG [Dechloromonas sp.]|nr:endolytic transglycosylase MltG [Dechloromonas sp.]
MRSFLKFFLFLSLLFVALAAAAVWWANAPIALREATVDFRITPKSSLRSAAAQMQEAGVDINADLLALLARWQGGATGIKAGSYSVKRGITPNQLLTKLVRGEVTQGEVLLVEGWTFRQWRARLDQHPDLKHETLGLSEAEIANRLGIDGGKLEGWLLPDTYLFDKQSSDIELLARAHRAMKNKLDLAWNERAPGLPYKTPYEVLIMASIVEKETGRSDDRAQVAGVFVNRLRKGMLLQTDPTVIYGLGETFDGNLRKRDLQTDTPYNTYARSGLPPTPIAMPGLASIQAALHPSANDMLYFVARGDGSSHFSRTLDEHNKAVSKYQKGGK